MIASGKRNRQNDDNGRNKRSRPETRSARDAVCPWWDVPYDEQLSRKSASMLTECLRPIHQEVLSSYSQYNKQRKSSGQSPVVAPAWMTAPASAGRVYCSRYWSWAVMVGNGVYAMSYKCVVHVEQVTFPLTLRCVPLWPLPRRRATGT